MRAIQKKNLDYAAKSQAYAAKSYICSVKQNLMVI